MRLLCLTVLLLATPAAGQTLSGDQRFQTIEYSANRVPTVRMAAETAQIFLFAPAETIQTVALSEPGAFSVEVSSTGDGLTVRPNGGTPSARLSVRTILRAYEIELAMGSGTSVPQIIQFAYNPEPSWKDTAAPKALPGVSYKLSGSKALLPKSISDDGKKMYITWGDDQAIPAIFSLSPSGGEEMVNGFMRAGVFTIDRIHDRLVFRLDRLVATARRSTTARVAR